MSTSTETFQAVIALEEPSESVIRYTLLRVGDHWEQPVLASDTDIYTARSVALRGIRKGAIFPDIDKFLSTKYFSACVPMIIADCTAGDRLYLTGYNGGQAVVEALTRLPFWEPKVSSGRLEAIHAG